MDLCNNEQRLWILTSRALTAFQTTMTPMSSPCGPIQVDPFIFSRMHSLPHHCTRLDLFADGDDFSWQTIQTGRNRYYQRQLANQIELRTTATLNLLTNALKVHLNVGQNITINTSAIFMSLETLSLSALSRRTVYQTEGAHMQLPSIMQINANSTPILLRVRHPPSLSHLTLTSHPHVVGDATSGFAWHLSLAIQHQSLAISRTLALRLRWS